MKRKMILALMLVLTTAMSVFADGETSNGNLIDYVYDSFGNIIDFIFR